MNVTKKINPNTFEPDDKKLTLQEKYDHLIGVCENQEKLDTSILKDVLDKFMILYKNNIQFKKQVEMLENQLKEEKNISGILLRTLPETQNKLWHKRADAVKL